MAQGIVRLRLRKVDHRSIVTPLTPVERIVRRQQRPVASRSRNRNPVVGHTRRRMPVENEKQIAVTECHRLVGLVHQLIVGIAAPHHTVRLGHRQHGPVEKTELTVAQAVVVSQRPLAARITVAPAVPLARKVDPFGMTELVAHKIEIGLASQRKRHQPDHLVERHTALYGQIVPTALHRRVHRTPHQPEGNRLVAHQRLVVRLGIGHRPHRGKPVGQHVPDLPDVPRLVGRILQHPDPEVGHRHPQPVVKPNTTVDHRRADARHAAHLLGYGYGGGFHLLHQLVGQRQVGQSGTIHLPAEEKIGPHALGVAVVGIDHRGHPVEAEPVEMELLQPVADVGEQKTANLRLGVVEQHRIPIGVTPRLAGRRIEVVGTVQLVEPLVQILHIVGVNQIHNDGQPHRVGPAHQRLQLLRRTEPGRRCKKTGNVVPETAVIGMLGQRHQLDGIVACGPDARQHLFGKLRIGADPFRFQRHTDVALVDVERAQGGDVETVGSPVEGVGRMPELGREVLRAVVLNHPAGIGRNTLVPTVGAVHQHLVERAVTQPLAPVAVVQKNAPHPAAVLHQRQRAPLPAVEIPEEIDLIRFGQPLAKPPTLRPVVALEAEITVAVSIRLQRTGLPHTSLLCLPIEAVAVLQFPRSLFQPRIVRNHLQLCCHIVCMFRIT